MGKLNSFQGSISCFILNAFAGLVRRLPLGAALWIGRRIGDIAFMASPSQRRLVMAHLKVAFGKIRPYAELEKIRRDFYHAFGQSIVEIGRLPLLPRQGYQRVIDLAGKEHIDQAMRLGRGCIFLSIHSGNWELSNIVGSMQGYPYNMVANTLDHMDKVAGFLDGLRQSAGCRIINPGIGGREIIRRLRNNEIVTLVADQGGADGVPVPFFGRNASMSTGAVRIALKYDVPVMLVDIHRTAHGRHLVTAEPFVLTKTADGKKDLADNLRRMMRRYEAWVSDHPAEYVWSYKTWKYAKDRLVLILDDGRVGHLRQSQAVAGACAAAGREKGIEVAIVTLPVKFRSDLAARVLPLLSGGDILYAGAGLTALRFFLDPVTLNALQRIRPDIVISCGARNAAVNFWVARDDRARSVAVLPNRMLPAKLFDLCLIPQHDLAPGERPPRNTVVTKTALNLIDRDYLDENVRALVSRYPHLRPDARRRIAVFIGGNAQGVVMNEGDMKVVLDQLRSAADQDDVDLLVTTSRRTPPAVERLVARELKDHPRTRLLIMANTSNVPEAVGGMLGLADVVVVSGESVSMVSEAASSGRTTIVFSLGSAKSSKYARSCENLAGQGHILYTPPSGIAAVLNDVLAGKSITRPMNDGPVLLDALRKVV